MKILRATLMLAMAATTMLACQNGGNTFTLNGTAKGLSEGDTLLIFSEENAANPSASITIGKDGKFTYTTTADTVRMMTICAAGRETMAQFFAEPGTATMTLDVEPENNTVAGTKTNDALQAMISSILPYAHEMETATNDFQQLAPEEQEEQLWEMREKMMKLYTEQALCILDAARHNIDNELGFYLVTQYRSNDPEIDQQLLALIDSMPEVYQQRPVIADIRPKTSIADFTMDTPDGGTLSIMDEIKKNRVTLIDFWASWCGPCREEMPFMVSLYEKYKDKGMGIVGVSLDNDGDAWRKAIAELHITWPQMSDLEGWENAAAQEYKVNSIPHIIIVDSNGTILTRGLRGEKLAEFVAAQLD